MGFGGLVGDIERIVFLITGMYSEPMLNSSKPMPKSNKALKRIAGHLAAHADSFSFSFAGLDR